MNTQQKQGCGIKKLMAAFAAARTARGVAGQHRAADREEAAASSGRKKKRNAVLPP